MKCLQLRIYPTNEQQEIFNEWMDTSRYIYNLSLEKINKKELPSKLQEIRKALTTKVTRTTNPEFSILSDRIRELKKQIKEATKASDDPDVSILKQEIKNICATKNALPKVSNDHVPDWIKNTPKSVLDTSINDVCLSMKTGFSNLKSGLVKFFKLKYRRKLGQQTIGFEKKQVQISKGKLYICKQLLGGQSINIGKYNKNIKLDFNHECRLSKFNGKFFLNIPISTPIVRDLKRKGKDVPLRYCGVDPGVRDFMTTCGSEGFKEYKQTYKFQRKMFILNNKIKFLKYRRCNNYFDNPLPFTNKRFGVRKRSLNKREAKKSNLVKEFHHQVSSQMLKHNDVIFYGDIKSHGIVSGGKNKTLNKMMNDLKFYQFKQVLLQKAKSMKDKFVYCVNEAYTTKTCSSCGYINYPKKSKIYKCMSCLKVVGRDTNASKNILMKGIQIYFPEE